MNLFSLLELSDPSSPVLEHWRPWYSGFQTQARTYAIPLDSRGFALGLNYVTGFLGSPA